MGNFVYFQCPTTLKVNLIAGKYETCRHRNIFNQKYFHTTKNRWKSLKLVQRKKFKDSFLSITIGYRKLKGWESCYSSFINATRDVRGANSPGFDWLPQRGSSLSVINAFESSQSHICESSLYVNMLQKNQCVSGTMKLRLCNDFSLVFQDSECRQSAPPRFWLTTPRNRNHSTFPDLEMSWTR